MEPGWEMRMTQSRQRPASRRRIAKSMPKHHTGSTRRLGEPGPSVDELSPAAKAVKTARWARIMVKWWITKSRAARGWEIVNFTGPAGRESRGIVDFLLIRKDHRPGAVARGDFFEIILVQVKGGSAGRPSREDLARLRLVADHYHARAVVLAEWVKGSKVRFSQLKPVAAVTQKLDPWDEVEHPKLLFA
jgi:hypothetical protein